MNQKLTLPFQIGWFVLLMPLMALGQTGEKNKEFKFEVRLIWATTNSVHSDPKHKPVEPEILKKLDKLPLKWASYFEINQKQFGVLKGKSNKIPISEKCALEVKDVDGKKVEVIWFGKNEKVIGKQIQPLSKGEFLILGGNAPAATAWFVILKRIE